jgi:methyl-accepting chemotaxis protein
MIGAIQTGTGAAVDNMASSCDMSQASLALVELAKAALSDIIAANNEISDRNAAINTATEEQAHVARAVDQNLLNIRELSIQSAEGATQTTAASQSLSALAYQLNTMVKGFRI